MNNLMTINYTPAKSKAIQKHVHSKWEFVYYISGSGVLTVGDLEYPFKAGDIICQPPHIPHSERSIEGFHNIFLLVDSYEFDRMEVHRFEDNKQQDVFTVLSMLYRTFHLKKDNWLPTVESLLDVFNHFIVANVNMDSKNKYVQNLEEVLVKNIGNCHFDLKTAMNQFPICNDHLRRIFKKENGMSPRAFIRTKRMDHAKSMIINHSSSMYSIKYIASLVGYADPYHFSKTFKKHNGVSPSYYNDTLSK